jgi:NDP-sugar pyrophosphorylase family protein
MHQLRKLRAQSVVGEACRLSPGVKLVDTVLGDRVTIGKPATLERCVVMSDVQLEDGRDYHDTVITAQERLEGAADLFQEGSNGSS